jgi:DNA primase
MVINDVLARLSKVKKKRDGYTALCPSHDDESPSFSIREAGDKILVKCFAGCSPEQICSSLGIEVKDLFTNTDTRFDRNNKKYKKVLRGEIPAVRIGRGASGAKQPDVPIVAEPERLNEVYTYFLESLRLDSAHGDHLLNERGLGDTTIVKKLYASVPDENGWREINREMRKQFGESLRGVAGFYKDGDALEWQARIYRNGYFIPYRDVNGFIVGLSIRPDGMNPKPKYYWFSTPPSDYTCGTSSGTPLHFVKPDLVKQTKQIIITEGALKADRIGEFTDDEAVVAIAGVSCFPDTIAADLQKQLTELRRVVIAFDMDMWTNPNVKTALVKLIGVFRSSGLEVQVKNWDIAEGKGYDDYLFVNRGGLK